MRPDETEAILAKLKEEHMEVSKRILAAAAIVLSTAVSVPAQQTMPPCCVDQWNPGRMLHDQWRPQQMGPMQRQRMVRHWTYMNEGVPTAYRGLRSTVSATAGNVSEGRTLYEANCAECHGAVGMGDGEAGRSLSPSPALLSHMVRTPMAVDEYLMWSISEGGVPFGTDMPAFKDKLSEDEIWKIIVFMRAGFPQSAAKK